MSLRSSLKAEGLAAPGAHVGQVVVRDPERRIFVPERAEDESLQGDVAISRKLKHLLPRREPRGK